MVKFPRILGTGTDHGPSGRCHGTGIEKLSGFPAKSPMKQPFSMKVVSKMGEPVKKQCLWSGVGSCKSTEKSNGVTLSRSPLRTSKYEPKKQ